jgi:hypothetical protein
VWIGRSANISASVARVVMLPSLPNTTAPPTVFDLNGAGQAETRQPTGDQRQAVDVVVTHRDR